MKRRRDHRRKRHQTARFALILVCWLGLMWPRVGLAQSELGTVVLSGPSDCADPHRLTSLRDQLATRLQSWRLSDGPAGSAQIVWRRPDHGATCSIRLSVNGRVETLPLPSDASESAIRNAAIRLAFWLEALPEAEAGSVETETETESESESESVADGESATAEATTDGDISPVVVTVPHEDDGPIVWQAPITIGAGVGASLYPGPGDASGMVRLLLGVPVSRFVQLALEFRLGTEISIPSPGLDTDFFDRSIGVLARYLTPIGADWLLDFSLGMRWGLPEFEIDDVDDADAELATPLSNLAAVVGVGGGYNLSGTMRLRLDVVGGVSVANRRVIGPDGELAELGVATVEVLSGLEISF